jgi:hypothetical protein
MIQRVGKCFCSLVVFLFFFFFSFSSAHSVFWILVESSVKV